MSRAEKVIRFVNSLPCTAGLLAGTTLKLRPWQKRFIRSVYKTDKAGNRAVRTAVLSVGRKNGKTQLAAALCLRALSGPEQRAARRMLLGRLHAGPGQARLRRDGGHHREDAMARQAHKHRALQEGIGGHSQRLDVQGAVGRRRARVLGCRHRSFATTSLPQAPNRELYDALSTALGARVQPLMMVISTQAARDEAPMSELIDYGLRIQRGEIADPVSIYALHSAAEADPWEFATWKLANPALGDFRSLDDVKRMALQAQRMPASE